MDLFNKINIQAPFCLFANFLAQLIHQDDLESVLNIYIYLETRILLWFLIFAMLLLTLREGKKNMSIQTTNWTKKEDYFCKILNRLLFLLNKKYDTNVTTIFGFQIQFTYVRRSLTPPHLTHFTHSSFLQQRHFSLITNINHNTIS